jgi:hypothetical protein
LRVSKTPRIDEVDRKLLGLEEIQKEARKRDNRAQVLERIKSKSPNNAAAIINE